MKCRRRRLRHNSVGIGISRTGSIATGKRSKKAATDVERIHIHGKTVREGASTCVQAEAQQRLWRRALLPRVAVGVSDERHDWIR